MATAVLRLSYPARTGSPAAHTRKPQYLTAGVASLGITITSFNGSTTIPASAGPTSFNVPVPTSCPPAVNGLVTCTVTFFLPPGNLGLNLTAYDGNKNIISEQQGTYDLVVGVANALRPTLDANTASIVVTPPAGGVTLSGTGCPTAPIKGPGDLSLSCTANLSATQNLTVSLADADTIAIAPTIGATVSGTPGAPVLSASSSNANFSASIGFVMGTATLTLTPGMAAMAGASSVITVTATPATCATLPCADGLAPVALKFTASVPAYPSGVYVVDSGSFSVTSYALGSNGNVAPMLTISNSTALSFAEGLAFDGGNLYVADTTGTINEFAAGSSGNAMPVATITGSNTALNAPAWLAFDSAGRLYVSNTGGAGITVYGAGANGNVAPIRTIAGSQTQITVPEGVAFDSNGNLYVANQGPNEVLAFAPGASGNVPPSAIIAGGATGLTNPIGLAFDASGNLYVSNINNEILVFAKGATGNVPPIQTIGGLNTQLVSLRGVAVDASGNIYAANDGTSTVTVYPKGSNGNVAPSETIGGGNTGLSGPFGIAVH